jgi:hypothetical protein
MALIFYLLSAVDIGASQRFAGRVARPSPAFPSLTTQMGALSFAKQRAGYKCCVPPLSPAYFILLRPPTRQVSGHDFSGLPEMTLSVSKGNRGLRSRAIKVAKNFLPCAAGSCAAKRSTLKATTSTHQRHPLLSTGVLSEINARRAVF